MSLYQICLAYDIDLYEIYRILGCHVIFLSDKIKGTEICRSYLIADVL